jgi:hypothetical protein
MAQPSDAAAAGCVQVWHQGGLTYDHEPNNFRSRHVNVTLPASVAEHNASAFLHVWVVAAGYNPSPLSPHFARSGAVHVIPPLVKHMPKRKKKEPCLLALVQAGN